MRHLLLFILLFLLSGCSKKAVIYITGEKDSVNAEVIIDGQKETNMAEVSDGALSLVKVEPGKHVLEVINKKGEKFRTEFSADKENFITVIYGSLNKPKKGRVTIN